MIKKIFWQDLTQPIMALAPMANVTDAAFRRIIAKYGKPDVMWTEFVSCDGLCSVGREKLLVDFLYSESERPIVAQIFGSNPKNFYATAQLIAELGFDGIDINMGCPDRNVEKQGGGAAMIKDPERAQMCIREAQRGAPALPVSVKTRLGYNRITIDEWLPALLDCGLAAITVHGRTRKEMSKVPAHWDEIGRAAEIACGSGTLILGNGDVESLADAREKVSTYGVDGVMIGRGIFGNPWLFSAKSDVSIQEKLRVLAEHTALFEKLLGASKSFDIMKKHFKAYVSGFDGAKELRAELMAAKNAKEVAERVKIYLNYAPKERPLPLPMNFF